jgi:hypothetical protein
MKTLTANDAKCGFGRLIDLARAVPMAVAKHERPVVFMMALEKFERLREISSGGHRERELRVDVRIAPRVRLASRASK